MVKEVDVEEPWYAPHGVFVDTVQEQLIDSIRASALQHAKKICGGKVDALHK